MDVVQALATALTAASAVLFFLVGRTVHRRPVSPEARSARNAFTVWWMGMAGITVAGLLMTLPGFPLDLTLYLLVLTALLAALCASLAGLLHYLVFLYTSSRRPLPFLVAGYAAYFLLLVAFILQNEPDGLERTRWGLELHYATPIESGPLYWGVLLLLILPPVGGALAYLSLYWRTKEPLLRRRILLVSLSLAIWFGSSLVGTAPGAQDQDWWRLTSRIIGLAATAVILYAYAGLGPARPEEDTPEQPPSAPQLYEGPDRRVASV